MIIKDFWKIVNILFKEYFKYDKIILEGGELMYAPLYIKTNNSLLESMI